VHIDSGIVVTVTGRSGVKPVLPFTRLVFVVAATLATIAGIQLYILTEATDRYFAWTIQQPLSAAFLGAGYWTGVVLLLFAVREREWANIRIVLAAVGTFVPLMLLTTLLHLDRFHFAATDTNPRVAAWAWMAVYAVVPVLLVAVIVLQLRTPGGDTPAPTHLPLWLRLLLGANAGIALVVGVLLFAFPSLMSAHWAWPLTPLTSRAVGTGFLALALASFAFIRENAWVRGRVGTGSYLLIGALQLIALARFHDTARWGQPGAWLYLVYMAAIFGGGLYSTAAAWWPRRHALPA
jgi:hypothetical protein